MEDNMLFGLECILWMIGETHLGIKK